MRHFSGFGRGGQPVGIAGGSGKSPEKITSGFERYVNSRGFRRHQSDVIRTTRSAADPSVGHHH